MAAQLARALGTSLDSLAGLAAEEPELVEFGRKLTDAPSEQQREALEGHLWAVLELAGGR
jgi:hypothetical protein